MQRFSPDDRIGDLVAAHPRLAAVLEEAGLDYCCGGRRSLREACAERALDPRDVLTRYEEALAEADRRAAGPDPMRMSLAELADHIVGTHHAWLRRELPRLDQLTGRVAERHGSQDPRLAEVRDTLLALAGELQFHMTKEEEILFPAIRGMETPGVPADACGWLGAPIAVMEEEHASAGAALARLRELTGGFAPPEWACSTYRAMLDGLRELESDLHQHIHKENNVLFPRALSAVAER